MDKLEFTFDEELFGGLQRGDWCKAEEVESAIKDFLDDDVKKIRVDNGEEFDVCGDFFQVDIDTREMNHDDGISEYLVLGIKSVIKCKRPLDRLLFTSKSIYVAIEFGDKLAFEKHGNIARIGLR